MSASWSEVTPEVLNIANEIIRDYHPDLEEAKIGFLFRSEPTWSGGRITVGKAMKIDKKYAPLMTDQDLDFLIWISYPDWMRFTTDQRKALIDHELCHLRYNDGDCSLVGHDIEEFGEIIERWGFWNSGLFKEQERIKKAVQTSMFPKSGGVFAVLPEQVEPETGEIETDDLLQQAVKFVREKQSASTSALQRYFRIGYVQAAKLMDELEERGVIGPDEGGGRAREVLLPPQDEADQEKSEAEVEVSAADQFADKTISNLLNRPESDPNDPDDDVGTFDNGPVDF